MTPIDPIVTKAKRELVAIKPSLSKAAAACMIKKGVNKDKLAKK